MRRLAQAVAVILAWCAAPVVAEPWREASAPHFVIYAQYSAEELRNYAVQLERFHKAMEVLRRLPGTPVGNANRVTIYVMSDAQAVSKLAGAAGGGIAGFYRRRAGDAIAVTSREKADHWTDMTPQIVLFHEYAHHFMLRYFPAAYPAWFREGFAEFNSTARFLPDGGMEIGAPANHRAYELAVIRRPDVALMLADPGRGASVGSMELYGFGWLLTHYLTFNDARKGQLAKYLDAINAGTPGRDAAIAAFGDLPALQREVMRYRRDKVKLARLRPEELPVGAIAVRDLAPGEAAMLPVAMRARLADADENERGIAREARRIAQGLPRDVAVLVALAQAEFVGGDMDAANAAAAQATTTDPRSIDALLIQARVALRRAVGAGDAAAKRRFARDARRLSLAANRIDADHPVPLLLFYQSFVAANEQPTANAVQGLTSAHLLAPEDSALRLLLAEQMIADAKPKEARILLTPVAFDTHGGKQTEAAQALLAKLTTAKPGE